jgi:ATP-binding cassette subfamily B protein
MAETFEEEQFAGQLNLPLWKAIARRARPHGRYFIALWSVGIGIAICDSLFGLVIKHIVDSAELDQAGKLALFALAFFILVTLQCGTVLGFILLAGKCSTGVSHDIRTEAFAKLQSLEFGYFDRRPVGWLMSRLTSDCQRLAGLLAWSLIDLVWGPTLMIGLATVMLAVNWRLALIVFAVIPPLAIVSAIFQRLILHSSRQVRKLNSQVTAGYNESIMAVRTTKTLVREEANLGEFRDLTSQMYRASMQNIIRSTLYMPIVQTIGSLGLGLALWFGGGSVVQGRMDLGTLLLFFYCTAQFFGPVHEIARVFNDVLSAQAAAERVHGLLTTEPAIKDSPEVEAAIIQQAGRPVMPNVAVDGQPNIIETIEFRDVTFAYNPDEPVLHDFNLRVRAGQTIALVGPTGGGKSTIVSLMCRFYEPTSGQVLINGTDYRERSLHWLQSNLGIVLQTPHLFSGTVKENIRYGRLNATDEEIMRAARLVNAHEFIMAMPEGYKSEVGQGGNRLSVGQRQLVSFARAVLADPQIFVMDEATSSVDTETEKAIQAALTAVLRGRISFIIAHRLSTIKSADVILVIDAGRIIEHGDHHALIQQRGRYYELYTNQFTREHEEAILGPAPTALAGGTG